MKALLLREYRQLEVVDMPTPEMADDEVLVRVRACGICGSDIHGFDGSSGRRIPPLVMGHEASGVIEKMGARVANLEPGMRVTFDSTVYCGRCHYCRRGQINLCDHRRVLGVACGEYSRGGAFAEYVVVPGRIVYPLPDALSFEHAAMVEPVSVAVHAVNRTPISLGDTAVVVGSGMIGLLVIQALRLAGCGQIIAVDLEDRKLKLAAELGADVGLNPNDCEIEAEVARHTAGRGADVALEAVGATPTVSAAIASLRKGGVLTLVGNLAPEVDLPLQAVVTRELTLIGTCGSCGEYPRSIDLLATGRINAEPLISAAVPLNEGPEWFDRLYNKEPGVMKVILQP